VVALREGRLITFVVALWASSAHAQAGAATGDPSAETLPTATDDERKQAAETSRLRALEFYDAGDYLAARREFQRASELMPSYRLLYNLGVVSLALNDFAAAFEFFERYLAEGAEAIPPATRETIATQLLELTARIATVRLRVDVTGAVVAVDDVTVGVTPLAAPLRLGAGKHRISATGSDARSVSRTLQLTAGESVELVLELSPPPARRTAAARRFSVPPPPLSDVQPSGPAPWLGWTATGVLASATLVSGLKALAAQRDYQKKFDGISSSAELERADTTVTRWSVATDVLGGATLVAGVYALYLTLRSRPSSARTPPTTLPVSISTKQLRVDVVF
jgi:tetratricopeptide (TPR) repeat protein